MGKRNLESKSIDAYDFIIENGPHFERKKRISFYDKISFMLSRIVYHPKALIFY